ncbi:MAG: hypothetical protein IPL10_09205 [Bacteroidetes bacterium]|nr:hypothetical protein [Bacteroidota bacterium]
MKKLLEYIPLFTICLLFFGYTNLHSYYQEFRIDIYNHISNTEIILSFLPTIVVWSILIYSFFYQILINEAVKRKEKVDEIEDTTEEENIATVIENEPENEQKKIKVTKASKIRKVLKNIFTSFHFYFFGWGIVSAILKLILLKYYFSFQLQEYDLFVSFVVIFIVYMGIKSKRNEVEYISENPIVVSIFIILFINLQISNYRKQDAKKIMFGISEKEICFKYNGKVIQTYSKLFYVGQTQSNLFLFNRSTKVTQVFNINNIDSLTIKESRYQYKY